MSRIHPKAAKHPFQSLKTLSGKPPFRNPSLEASLGDGVQRFVEQIGEAAHVLERIVEGSR